MSKHTPGPWLVTEAKTKDKSLCIVSEQGNIVVHRLRRGSRSDERLAADAVLIAAVHDLLTAAKGMIEAAGKSPALAMAFGSQHGLPAAKALKAAIDKAEGRQ